MNANEISPKANLRLHRIKIVSRIVRYALLAMLVLIICASSLSCVSAFKDNPWYAVPFVVGLQIVICLWYWKLAQLFRLYERGLIFSSETIRCMKILGILCVAGWILLSVWHGLIHLFPQPLSVKPLPPGVTITTKIEGGYRFGFFTFVFAGINLGQLLAGIIIILIAWIMDEGRKIQEEQELTV
jgi:hypothetical protein